MNANRSNIWLLDQNGHVKRFDAKNQTIHSLTSLDLNNQSRFVKLTSSLTSLWAISCEGGLKVYVLATHVPIREHLYTFENQRWNPLKGFCDQLLPTDRPIWSDVTGTKHWPKHHFQLPSNAWAWERDWCVQERLPNGQTLDSDGWSYAIDFSLDSHFVAKRSMLMMVRKRKWTRTQRFVGYERWLAINDLPDKQGFDRIVAVAVGGEHFQTSIAEDSSSTQNQYECFDEDGVNDESLAVWVLTSGGNLYFRRNVCRLRPQGTGWQKVSIELLDQNSEQLQRIAIAPNGSLWTLSSSGRFYVRGGISRKQLSGQYWTIITLPNEVHVVDLSLSSNYVWALADRPKRKILFRVGIRSKGLEKDRDLIGHGWSEIEGEIGALSAAANEQLWALDCDHMTLWIRCGVTESEPVGKSWQKLDKQYLNNLETFKNESVEEESLESFESTWLSVCARSCEYTFEIKKYTNSINSPWRITIYNQLQQRVKTEMVPYTDEFAVAVESESIVLKLGEAKLLLEPLQQEFEERPVSLLAYAIDNTLSNTPIAKLLENASQLTGNIAVDRFSKCILQLMKFRNGTAKNWILKMSSEKEKRWIDQFVNLSDVLCIQLLPIDRKLWINRLLTIHLQQSEPLRFGFESETLTEEWSELLSVSSNKAHQSKHQVFTSEPRPQLFLVDAAGIVYVGICSKVRDGDTESTIEDKSVCKLNELSLNLEKNICSSPSQLYFRSLGQTHFREIACTSKKICWALNFCGQVYVYSGKSDVEICCGSNSTLNEAEVEDSHEIVDWIQVETFENQRWFPMQGFSHNLLPTDRPKWSDRVGLQEVQMTNVKLPSRHWQWSEDWKAETDLGNCDSDGWSYALDFTTEFHGRKRLTDCVRRRRWTRKARYVSRGPWKPLDESNLKLKSLSMCDYETEKPDWNSTNSGDIKSDSPNSNSAQSAGRSSGTSRSLQSHAYSSLIVWAISHSGDALCRVGVRPNRTVGETWFHVACSKRLNCISVSSRAELGDVSSAGTDFTLSHTPFVQAWALSDDGSVFLRHGITLSEPAGTLWLSVPTNVASVKFVRLFAIPSGCLAITDCHQLWYREGIQRTRPDGLRWSVVPQSPELKIQNVSCTRDAKKIFANGWLPDGRPVFCVNENPTVDMQQNFHLQWSVILYDCFAAMCVLS